MLWKGFFGHCTCVSLNEKNIFRKFNIISVFVNAACIYSTYKIQAVKGIFVVIIIEWNKYHSEKKNQY